MFSQKKFENYNNDNNNNNNNNNNNLLWFKLCLTRLYNLHKLQKEIIIHIWHIAGKGIKNLQRSYMVHDLYSILSEPKECVWERRKSSVKEIYNKKWSQINGWSTKGVRLYPSNWVQKQCAFLAEGKHGLAVELF